MCDLQATLRRRMRHLLQGTPAVERMIFVALVLWACAGSAAAGVVDNLVAYWPFGEGSGQTTRDWGRTPLEDTGTLGANASPDADDPTWIPGVVGSALGFDGTNDFVIAADSADLRPAALSIAYWVNPSSAMTGYRDIISKRSSTAGNKYGFLVERNPGGAVSHYLWIDDSLNPQWRWANLTYVDDQWQHIVVTWQSGSKIDVWRNGTLAAQSAAAYTGFIPYDATSLTIGRNSQGLGSFFQGGLDEVAIWNRVLTSTEIAELYNSGAGVSLVPEPGALLLLLAGAPLIGLRRR